MALHYAQVLCNSVTTFTQPLKIEKCYKKGQREHFTWPECHRVDLDIQQS